MDFAAQCVRVTGIGTGKLHRSVQTVHQRVRRPLEFHLLLIIFGAVLGYIALQEVGLAVAGTILGPILIYTLTLGGLWGKSIIQAARNLGKDPQGHP